ncbi:MAG: hypothetical protein LBC68_13665 [Prevotellaceae bacterium]|jgi:hypothetical protein|nr:hypothetical protein [Prevotellaceae bacterium]
MKKILAVILLALPIIAQAQRATTEEEYNYITKGYAIQISSGLDMKRGYYFKDLGVATYNTTLNNKKIEQRKATFKALYRTGEQKSCAIMVIYQRSGYDAVYYCIPSKNAPQTMWDKTLSAFDRMGTIAKTAIIYGLSLQVSSDNTVK